MELGNLVTKDGANEGKWFQVILYGQKQNFDIKILGEDSDVVQNYNRAKLRKMKNAVKKGSSNLNDIDDDTMEELLDSADENVIVRIDGLRTHGNEEEPLTIGKKVLKNDKESYRLLIENIPAIKDFVLNKSNERTNFLS